MQSFVKINKIPKLRKGISRFYLLTYVDLLNGTTPEPEKFHFLTYDKQYVSYIYGENRYKLYF